MPKAVNLVIPQGEYHVTYNKVSIIIPAFNEASCIKRNIMAVREAVDRITRFYEIIIAEDGSTDGTDFMSRELAMGNSWIVHSHSKERLGKGNALRKAFEVSHGEVIVYMDADIATSLDCLPRMMKEIESGYDMAIGSRMIKGSRSKRSFSRIILSWIYNIFVKVLFRTGVFDHQCGFKAFRREMFEAIIDALQFNGFIFDTEFIVRAKYQGFSIIEFPVIWTEPEGRLSKVQLLIDGVRMGIQLLRLRVELLKH